MINLVLILNKYKKHLSIFLYTILGIIYESLLHFYLLISKNESYARCMF